MGSVLGAQRLIQFLSLILNSCVGQLTEMLDIAIPPILCSIQNSTNDIIIIRTHRVVDCSTKRLSEHG